MMRVLLIKTSSMGDIIHTLPALTDAKSMIPGIQFDWVIEENFTAIPAWHASVDRIIPVALRRWRNHIFSQPTRKEWQHFRQNIKRQSYDLILDAQGLAKSAWLVLLANGTQAGLDWYSAREKLASLFYQKKYSVNFHQHAVIRMRQLFSLALGYDLPESEPDFGMDTKHFSAAPHPDENYIVFLHGTTWVTKEWPEIYWIELAKKINQLGYRVKISGGNNEEVARADRIAKQTDAVDVLPRLTLSNMAELLFHAKAAIAVDTGFGHLAAALGVPTVSIYGPTNPHYTGALGNRSLHLAATFPCAPCLNRICHYKKPSAVTPACYTTITPEKIMMVINNTISSKF